MYIYNFKKYTVEPRNNGWVCVYDNGEIWNIIFKY